MNQTVSAMYFVQSTGIVLYRVLRIEYRMVAWEAMSIAPYPLHVQYSTAPKVLRRVFQIPTSYYVLCPGRGALDRMLDTVLPGPWSSAAPTECWPP